MHEMADSLGKQICAWTDESTTGTRQHAKGFDGIREYQPKSHFDQQNSRTSLQLPCEKAPGRLTKSELIPTSGPYDILILRDCVWAIV